MATGPIQIKIDTDEFHAFVGAFAVTLRSSQTSPVIAQLALRAMETFDLQLLAAGESNPALDTFTLKPSDLFLDIERAVREGNTDFFLQINIKGE